MQLYCDKFVFFFQSHFKRQERLIGIFEYFGCFPLCLEWLLFTTVVPLFSLV